MKIDANKSEYHPVPDARQQFTSDEVDNCEVLLRRLRFLEHQVKSNGLAVGSGGAGWALLESKALAWILRDAGYLPEDVSRNTNTKEKTT